MTSGPGLLNVAAADLVAGVLAIGVLAIGVLAIGVLAGGCKHNLVELPPDQPCLDAGYSIAARTFECTGDADLANARFEAFERQFRCKPVDVKTDPVADYYHCSVEIGALSCEKVEAFGDEISCWVGVSPACPYVIEYADGTQLGAKSTDARLERGWR